MLRWSLIHPSLSMDRQEVIGHPVAADQAQRGIQLLLAWQLEWLLRSQ